MNSIPKGYKKTDVGVIPDDWEVKILGEEGVFLTTSSYTRSELKEYGDVACIHYGDIHTRFHTWLDCASTALPMISRDMVKQYPYLKNGDLVIADASEDYEGLGDCVEICNMGAKLCIGGLHTIVYRAKPGLFAPSYIGLLRNLEVVRNQFVSQAVGTKVYSLTNSMIGSILVPIPSLLSEQKAIAEALSDMNALIEAQKELIAKKRDIKQGTMQDLLSGRVRLPGYETKGWKHTDIGDIPDDWDVKKLGEEGIFLTTSSYTRSELREYGDVACLHYGDIHTRFHTWLDCSSTELPMISRDMVKQYPYLKNGDLVIADASEDYEGLGDCVEICNIDSKLCIGGLHTIVYRAKPGLFAPSYIGLLRNLQVVRNQLVSQAVGTKVYSLTNSMIGSILVAVPFLLSEQQAIAEVLSDMDNEIETLEAELEKLNHIKRGMMQELLTGRIRLI